MSHCFDSDAALPERGSMFQSGATDAIDTEIRDRFLRFSDDVYRLYGDIPGFAQIAGAKVLPPCGPRRGKLVSAVPSRGLNFNHVTHTTAHLENSISMSTNAFNSTALPVGSRKSILASSTGSPVQ